MKLHKRLASLMVICMSTSTVVQVMPLEVGRQKEEILEIDKVSKVTTSGAIGITTDAALGLNEKSEQIVEVHMMDGNTTLPVNTISVLEVGVSFDRNSTTQSIEINLPEHMEVLNSYTDESDPTVGKFIKSIEVVKNRDNNSTTLRYEFKDAVAGIKLGLSIPIRIQAKKVITGDEFIINTVLSGSLGSTSKDLVLTAENAQRYGLGDVIGNRGGVVLNSYGSSFQAKVLAEKKGLENLTRLTDAALIIPLPDEVDARLGTGSIDKYTLEITPDRKAVVTGFKELEEIQQVAVNLICNNQVLGKVYKATENIKFEYKLDGRTELYSYEIPGVELKVTNVSATRTLVKEWVDVKKGQKNTILGAVDFVAGENLLNFETKIEIPNGIRIRGFGIETGRLNLQENLRIEYTTNKGHNGIQYIPNTNKRDILITANDMGFEEDEYITEVYIKADKLLKGFKVFGEEKFFFYGDVAENVEEGKEILTYTFKYSSDISGGSLKEVQRTGEVRIRPDNELETPVRLKVFDTSEALYRPGDVIPIKSQLEVAYDTRIFYTYRYEVENPVLHYVIPEEFEFIPESVIIGGIAPEKLSIKTYNKNDKNIMTIQVNDTTIGGLNQELKPLNGIVDIDFDIRVSNTAKRESYNFNNPLMWLESEKTGFFDKPGTGTSYKVEDKYGLSLADKLTATNVDVNNPLDNLIEIRITRGRVVAIERSIKSEIDTWKDYKVDNPKSICNFKRDTSGVYRMVIYNGQDQEMTDVKLRIQLPKKGIDNDFSVNLEKIEIISKGDVTYYLNNGTSRTKDTMTQNDLSKVIELGINIAKISVDEEIVLEIPLWTEESNIDFKSKYASITANINYMQNGVKNYNLPEAKLQLLGNVVGLNSVPVITASDREIIEGSSFDTLEGVSATDKEDDAVGLPLTVRVVNNTVDVTTPGEYEVTYEVTDSQGATARKTIKVKVHKRLIGLNSIPVITASDREIVEGSSFDALEGVSATDKEDDAVGLPLTVRVVNNTVDVTTPGEYEVTYEVTDSQGATARKAIKVKVHKRLIGLNSIPIITASDREIVEGSSFDALEGVSATDKEDDAVGLPLTVRVVNNTVDVTTPGEYEVIYEVTDSQGATARKAIKVKVHKKMVEMNQAPIIEMNRTEFTVGEEIKPLEYITIKDDGDIAKVKAIKVRSTIPFETRNGKEYFKEAGNFTITYYAVDEQGASTTKTFNVIVKAVEENKPDETIKPNKPIKPNEDKYGIGSIVHNGYINGYDDGTFMPNSSVTRGEVATMLTRILLDGENTPKKENVFSDVSHTYFAKDEINYLASMGVLEGYEDGTFRPLEPITRAEFATILARIEGLSTVQEAKTYKDINASHWAYDSIQGVTKIGYMAGYEDDRFRGETDITRAESVATLNRIYRMPCNVEDIQIYEVPYNDISEAHWAYKDILKSSIEHKHAIEEKH